MDVNLFAGLSPAENPVIEEEIVYYSFDEGEGLTANDSAGDNDSARLTENTTVWAEEEDSLSGTAITFVGEDDYLSLFDHHPMGDAALKKSYAFWIQPSEVAPDEKEVIMQWGEDEKGMNVYLDGEVLYAGGWEEKEPAWSTFLSAPITRNEWHHVVLVLDATEEEFLESDGLRLYLNGVLVTSGVGGGIEGHGASRIASTKRETLFHDGSIGERFENYYVGTMDEFHYYHEYALSMEDIGKLYAFGNLGPVVNAGPDQSELSSLVVPLSGLAIDDGRWDGSLNYEWLLADRLGAGIISDANSSEASLELLAGGSYEVALTASDGHVTTYDTVVVSVDQPTYFELFMNEFPSLAGEDRDYLADPDFDLWTNLEEYGFGGAPDGSDGVGELRIQSQVVKVDGDRYFEFRFPRRTDAALRGLSYELEFSTDLAPSSWHLRNYSVIEKVSIDEGFEEIRLRLDEPIGSDLPSLFGRVRVVLKE